MRRNVIVQTTPATSMMAAIKSPITFYATPVVINQSGHTKELFDYYWSAYSRGTDISTTDPSIGNNTYLDGYSTLRTKSIYDPCPYSYRTPTNGTYNQFSNTYPKWTLYSCTGGVQFTLSTNSTWFSVTGYRYAGTGLFIHGGNQIGYRTATAYSTAQGYVLQFNYNNGVNPNTAWGRADGSTIRCIEAIKSPITFYGGSNSVIIDQTGHTKELFDYYWTSYSRGTDGTVNWTTPPLNEPLWNNTYLDGYSTLRTKSIYDPCPYSYRTPTNGTYNQFSNTYPAWTKNSYIGGAKWTLSTNSTWLPNTGIRSWSTGLFNAVGDQTGYWNATISSADRGYVLYFDYNTVLLNYGWPRSWGTVIRCIEDCGTIIAHLTKRAI